jgi:putative transposase
MTSRPKTTSTQPALDEAMCCAMQLRVYPENDQLRLASQWLYDAHKFRNEAVAFLKTRRRERCAWVYQHPVLAKEWIPEEYQGHDVLACSKWLTSRLQKARQAAGLDLGTDSPKNDLTEAVSQAWQHLSRGERIEAGDAWLLTVPRTVLDQVIQDLGKTVNKAYKDRKNKLKKPAGFPDFQKWSYGTSVRLQVNAKQNADYAAHWKAGKIYLPGLGVLTFRDAQSLPATPPKLITLSRNAANQWHASFVCVARETKAYRQAEQARKDPLPRDPVTGLPVAIGGDVGARTTLSLSDGKEHKRVRYADRQRRRLRNLSRGLARKQRGSKRWQKQARQVGKTHAKIAAQRDAGLTQIAIEVVKSSAIICLEDLFLKGMLQHPTLAATLHDAALGKLKQKIIRQAEKHGRLVLECGRFVPSTHTCWVCEKRHPEKLSLDDTTWTCTGCLITHERDPNAARVILREALKAGRDELQLYRSAHGSGAGTLPSPGEIPWSGLHPDLAVFIARGGLTALLDEQSSESRRVLEHAVSPQGTGQDGSREARLKPVATQPRRKGTAMVA